MKNIIEYFYKISIDKLYNENQIYYFDFNYYKYYFVPFLRPLEDLPVLNELANEMYKKGILCHTFIYNKDNVLYTQHNDVNYVLLRINLTKTAELSLKDIVDFGRKLVVKPDNKKLRRTDWGTLWSEKIDYFEYQIRQLGKNKKIIIDSFSYFIGLAENAISYFNMTSLSLKPSSMDEMTICHRRLFIPNYAFNFLNPLSFVIDYKVRDVAEYIKVLFFSDFYDWYEIESFLTHTSFTQFSSQLLFARLLYPSYYFDLYEQVMNGQDRESEIIKVIEKVNSYENFLKDIYDILNKKNPLPKVEWICDK